MDDSIRRYIRNTHIMSVVAYTALGVFIIGIIVAIIISVQHDNEFTKRCNNEGGYVISHDPLVCVSNDDRVIRIKQ